jgi:membrane protein insertase Oxa1/YidC/SpoIIIJ
MTLSIVLLVFFMTLIVNAGLFFMKLLWDRRVAMQRMKELEQTMQASEDRIAGLFRQMEENRQTLLERNEVIKRMVREREGGQ